MADLSFAVNDPLTAETCQLQRSQGGYYGAGGWSDNYTTMNYYGVIRPATAREIEALPPADRVHEVIVIKGELPIYVTRRAPEAGGPATSDLIIYHGESYRVIRTRPNLNANFWTAWATRMAGA